jgi:hypothetical protein
MGHVIMFTISVLTLCTVKAYLQISGEMHTAPNDILSHSFGMFLARITKPQMSNDFMSGANCKQLA